MKKTAVYVLCVFVLLNALPVCALAGEDGFYSGVVREGKFYHHDRKEWPRYYYVDIKKAQYDRLFAEIGEEVGNVGQKVRSEIQVYTTMEIHLKDYVGKKITFKADCF